MLCHTGNAHAVNALEVPGVKLSRKGMQDDNCGTKKRLEVCELLYDNVMI